MIEKIKKELTEKLGYFDLMNKLGDALREYEALPEETRALLSYNAWQWVHADGDRVAGDLPDNREESAVLWLAGYRPQPRPQAQPQAKTRPSLHEIHMEEADE